MTLYLIFFAVIAVVFVLAAVAGSSAMKQRELDRVKDLVSGKSTAKAEEEEGPSNLLKEDTDPKKALAKLFLGQNYSEKLRDYIEQAGMNWAPGRTIYMSLLLAVIGFNFFWYIVPRGETISIVGVIAGAGAPFLLLYQKRKKRLAKAESQFPDALEFISRAMRSGHAFSVSLEMLHKEQPPPLGEEFRRTFEEQNLGLPLEVALERLAKRLPLMDVQFFVSAVLMQKKTGGNLAALLDNLAYLIRERFKLRGRIRAVSAHGRISGLVLSMIPLVVALLMFYTNPEYVLFFFEDPDGRIMMAVCIALQFLGFVSIRKIVDIGV